MSKNEQKTLVNPSADDFTDFYQSFGENIDSYLANSLVSTFEEVRKRGKTMIRYDRRGDGVCFGFLFSQTAVLAIVGGETDVRKLLSPVKQKGFSLVEVIVALLVVVMIVVIASALLLTRAKAIDSNTTATAAENAAEAALSALSAKASTLAVSQSYTFVSDSAITLNTCTPSTCDFVLEPDASAELKISPAGGIPFAEGYAAPSGLRIAFVRRWRVEDQNSEYRLRKIGIAILESTISTSPIVLEDTTVGMGQ